MSKIFKKAYLTEDDVIEPIMTDVLTDVLRDYNRTVDKIAIEAFNKYGYAREWIFDPANRDRIRILCIGGAFMFRVDGRILFLMKIGLQLTEEYAYTTTYDIDYIAPLPEEINNG